MEDVKAVIEAAGGSALVYGFSSGGLLALHAAAAGLAIDKLALFEPPVRARGEPPETTFTNEIADLVAAGARGTAVDYFLISIGVPGEVIAEMAPMRPALEAVAHTLVYDCEISNATTFELLDSMQTPTLVPGQRRQLRLPHRRDGRDRRRAAERHSAQPAGRVARCRRRGPRPVLTAFFHGGRRAGT